MHMDELSNEDGRIAAKLWLPIEDVEQSAVEQIRAVMHHPRLSPYVAIMPDVHAGKGATIGSVIPLEDAVIPSAVGVDIGCGMCALKSNLTVHELRGSVEKVYADVRSAIPVGYSHREDNALGLVLDHVDSNVRGLIAAYEGNPQWGEKKLLNQLGTLGGGNHFIELQADEADFIWIMLHSGSRNIGHRIATYYIDLAKSEPKDAPKDLEYFDVHTTLGTAYLRDAAFATDFALTNRRVMMEGVKLALVNSFPGIAFESMINIHHNYVNFENHFGKGVWVHRKGATRVTPEITGIIPGSMGTSSFIVQGLGNTDSFNSCSHGAGRLMSRNVARGKVDRKNGGYKSEGVLTVEQFGSDMAGVFSKDIDRDHLDEAPRAYKDIDKVIAFQSDLIRVLVKLRPIMSVKG